MAKQYIKSADEEINEYFHKNIRLTEENIKNINGSLSSNISSAIEDKMKDFVYTSISVIDYYVDGIYNSGKQVSRNKLKLEKLEKIKGKKYSFNTLDEEFINNYKLTKLTSMNQELNSVMVKYLSYLINEKLDFKADLSDSEIISITNDCLISVYDEFFEILAREMIVLFKRAQLEEYKNIGIDYVSISTHDHSLNCSICESKSNKPALISDVISEFGIKDGSKHAFCKVSINPITDTLSNISKKDFTVGEINFFNVPIELEDKISNILKKIQIYFSSYLTNNLQFKFVDDISDSQEWIEVVKQHYIQSGKEEDFENALLLDQTRLKDSINTFTIDNLVYLSSKALKSQTIENVVLREIFRNKINVTEEVENLFNKRKESKYVGNGVAFYQLQFVSYLAEDSVDSYLLESSISYILNPQLLQTIDKQIYTYIKENMFNSIEF